MKTLKIMNALFLQTCSEAETKLRALEVLQSVKPILNCLRPSWKQRIEDLFKEFVDEGESAEKLMNRKDKGLYWPFEKMLFKGMCEAFKN